MYNRREFIKTTVAAGALEFTRSIPVRGQVDRSAEYFGIHPFVENHPEAVFIMRTNVDIKTNSYAMKDAGLKFGRSVFLTKDKGEGAFPLTNKIAIKPNLTCSSTSASHTGAGKSRTYYPLEYGMGIVTDPHFVEGVIEAMKELWLSGNQFYIREVNCPVDFGPRGFIGVADRTGAVAVSPSPKS